MARSIATRRTDSPKHMAPEQSSPQPSGVRNALPTIQISVPFRRTAHRNPLFPERTTTFPTHVDMAQPHHQYIRTQPWDSPHYTPQYTPPAASAQELTPPAMAQQQPVTPETAPRPSVPTK